MELNYSPLLEKILQHQNLSLPEAEWLMEATMSGDLTPAQVAAWLAAMRSKGETSEEISSFARIMRKKAVEVKGLAGPLVDTCGTGGDKSNLINVSTLSALVLASMGIPVAKHGNRSVSSASGSADILEKLGYPLGESSTETVGRVQQKNFGFLFAPNFHPAMKYAGPVRKELGVRTVFNILGPLSNPASAEIHLLGVFQPELMRLMAECLEKLGVKTAMVVHSIEGLDEISPVNTTRYVLLHKGEFSEGEILPETLDLSVQSLSQIQAATAEECLERAKGVIEGIDRPAIEAVALNATAGHYLWDLHHGKTTLDPATYLAEHLKGVIHHVESGGVRLDQLF